MRPLTVWLLVPIVLAQRFTEDDDAVVPGVDVIDSTPLPRRVPFGHIFKEGIEDPDSGMKQPIDPLELSLQTPLTRAEQAKYLKEVPPDRIYRIDKSRYRMYNEHIDEKPSVNTQKIDNAPKWFDFGAIHAEKSKNPGRADLMPSIGRKNVIRKFLPVTPMEPLEELAGIAPTLPTAKNFKWTTCKEFSKGSSSFHPKDIVDIAWTPFYIWSTRKIDAAVVHKFTYPTNRIVKEYKLMYSSLLNSSLDWEQPKLVLNETIEILLIADPIDRRGLFHGVPRRPVPSDPNVMKLVQFTVPKIRVKIVDPYLALMFCDEYFATIMATPENLPESDQERQEEASTLNFTGIGYAVQRDLEAEFAAQRAILQDQKDKEEMKYIKAYNVDAIRVDND